jgi:sterol desaturase/sphingolipid hydroxylase (fatty acid hydroxylase superfamily)
MLERIALIAVGLAIWTLLEYAIHGWLSHTFSTFAARLHAFHHRSPNNVFTVRAWVPIALISLASAAIFRTAPGMFVFAGAVLGFVGYESIHYRIHFRRPNGRLETFLRTRHLMHHQRPDRCFGVTSPLWDLIFHTESSEAEVAPLRAQLAAVLPLSGRTNLYKLRYLGLRCLTPAPMASIE